VGGRKPPLLGRIQDGLTPQNGPGTCMRRCPCCGQAIRAGQRTTTIHGTTVHARCASTR